MYTISDIQVEDTSVYIEAGDLTIRVSIVSPSIGCSGGVYDGGVTSDEEYVSDSDSLEQDVSRYSDEEYVSDSDSLEQDVSRYSDEEFYGVRLLCGEDCGHEYRCDCSIDGSTLIGLEIQSAEQVEDWVSFRVDGEFYIVQTFDYTRRRYRYPCSIDIEVDYSEDCTQIEHRESDHPVIIEPQGCRYILRRGARRGEVCGVGRRERCGRHCHR